MTIAAQGNGQGLPSFHDSEWQMPKHPGAAPSGVHQIALLQRIADPDPKRAAELVGDALASGAGGVALVFENAVNAFGQGLLLGPKTFDELFADVQPGKFSIRIDAHPHSRTTAEMLAAFLTRRRADVSKFSLSFGIDPAAIFAATGGLRMSIEALEASMPQSLGHFFAMGAPGILLEADGRVFHNAGATPAQELGTMISSAASYLRMFYLARQPLLYAVPHIGFSISVDDDFDESAAKAHAARLLWSRLQEIAGIAAQRASVHGEVSFRMRSGSSDADRSRAKEALSSARAGGVDSVSVDRIRDVTGERDVPARVAGSALEAHAADLAQRAWEEFRRLESEGGVLRSLAAGLLQKRIRDNGFGHSAAEIKPPGEAVVKCEPLVPIRAS